MESGEWPSLTVEENLLHCARPLHIALEFSVADRELNETERLFAYGFEPRHVIGQDEAIAKIPRQKLALGLIGAPTTNCDAPHTAEFDHVAEVFHTTPGLSFR